MTGIDGIGGTGGGPRLVEGKLGGEGFGAAAPAAGAKSGFANALFDALKRVEGLQNEAQAQSEAVTRGEGGSVQDLMVAMGKSDVAFNLMLEVRNKIVDAWQTLTRTVV